MSQITIDHALQLAIAHHQAGRLADAETIYRQILTAQPNHAEALNLLGVIAGQVGRPDLAANLVRQAIAVEPGKPEYHCNLGLFLKNQGQIDAAIASYQQAITLKPDYPDAHFNLAIAQKDSGRLGAAIASYQRTLELRPEFVEAHNNLGDALAAAGQIDRAIESYQRAIVLQPDYFRAHYNLANAWKDTGHPDKAIAGYQHALRLKPDFAQAHNNLGIAYADQGRLDLAIQSYQRALTLKPDYAESHYNLGNAWITAGQPDRAAASYRQAILQKSDYIEAHNNLGNALRDLGQIDQAMLCYQRAVTLRPNDPTVHYNLGVALKEEGQIPQATAAYRQALALNPDLILARRELAEVLSIDGKFRDAINILYGPDSPGEPAPQPDPTSPLPNVFVVCSIRNGTVDLLPHWLQHYSSMGVDQILIGIFEDLSPEVLSQIDACAARWPFTRFDQTWENTNEVFHEDQRRVACRAAGANAKTWLLNTDLDEFHEFPAPLTQIIAAAQAQGIQAISGWLLDRIAADGSLPPIRPAPPSLFEQFPIACRLTARVLRGGTQKVMLSQLDVPVTTGHHYIANSIRSRIPLGRPEQYIVHHFKWHADLVPRLHAALARSNIPRVWRNETDRFLIWLQANGGKINLAECGD